VLVAGASEPDTPGAGVGEALAELGARVYACQLAGAWEQPDTVHARIEQLVGAEVERALGELGSIDVLVVDGSSLFARAGRAAGGGPREQRRALLDCLDASWNLTRALAAGAFLAPARPGRIVYVAPAPEAGAHADAARAGLENLARTLSIEWARHAITTVAIAPGGGPGAAGEVAALSAYLASPAGAYFSGCLLDLRAGARAESAQ
jgi:NAD(P)-dependent dehydrogenase (short-subunit alcohol dehydrogenase family)